MYAIRSYYGHAGARAPHARARRLGGGVRRAAREAQVVRRARASVLLGLRLLHFARVGPRTGERRVHTLAHGGQIAHRV